MKYKSYEEWNSALDKVPSPYKDENGNRRLSPKMEFSKEYYEREFYKVWNLGKKSWQKKRHRLPPILSRGRVKYTSHPNTPAWYSFILIQPIVRIWNNLACKILGHEFISPFDGTCSCCCKVIKGAKIMSSKQQEDMWNKTDLALHLTQDYFDQHYINQPFNPPEGEDIAGS